MKALRTVWCGGKERGYRPDSYLSQFKADISSDLIATAYEDCISEVGDTVLAVPGVNSWRGILPVLKDMKVKRVNIAFDMDVIENEKVAVQYKAMLQELVKLGYEVYMAVWSYSDTTKGLDDVLLQKRRPRLVKI